MKDPFLFSENNLNSQQVQAIADSIRVFLVNEKLPPSDNFVAAILLYPPEDLFIAISAFEDSASLIPSVTRDKAVGLQYQLVAIFDQTFQALNLSWELSKEDQIKLQLVMSKYEDDIKSGPSLRLDGQEPPQSGNNSFYK